MKRKKLIANLVAGAVAASVLGLAGIAAPSSNDRYCDPTVFADGTPAPCLTEAEEESLLEYEAEWQYREAVPMPEVNVIDPMEYTV